MEKNTWQLQNAKNRFSEVVNRAHHEGVQLVTKNGKPSVYVVDCQTYKKVMTAKNKGKKNILLNRPHKDVLLDLSRDGDSGRNIKL